MYIKLKTFGKTNRLEKTRTESEELRIHLNTSDTSFVHPTKKYIGRKKAQDFTHFGLKKKKNIKTGQKVRINNYD